jgi:hypothetical protein
MSVVPISSSTAQSSQSIGTQILQQLLSQGSGTQDTSGLAGLFGDMMTLSPAAQQLQQAPSAVTQAMGDLFSGQKDVQGDLAKLKSYFGENPQSLANVLSSLQGTQGTYSSSGTTGGNQALLAALLNGQTSGSNSVNPVSLLMGMSNQDSLFTFMGDAGSGSSSSSLSLLG